MTETNGYSRYPITMAHPAFKASVPVSIPGTQIYNADGTVARQDYRGTPMMFPPVTAMSADDEERLKADGYQPAGKVDPSAWVRAHASTPADDYKPARYPKWGKNEHGEAVLYMTAEDDPEASAADLNPAPVPATAEPVAPIAPSQEANLRATMEEMNRVMAQMQETMRVQAEENVRLKAEAEARAAEPQPVKRSPGRPRKDA